MYQNKVNLIGFLGGDAEVRNANNRSFTTLSLATKSSYKDKKSGQYVAQPNGIAVSSSASLPSSPARYQGRARPDRSELRSREMRARRPTPSSASGRSASIPS